MSWFASSARSASGTRSRYSSTCGRRPAFQSSMNSLSVRSVEAMLEHLLELLHAARAQLMDVVLAGVERGCDLWHRLAVERHLENLTLVVRELPQGAAKAGGRCCALGGTLVLLEAAVVGELLFVAAERAVLAGGLVERSGMVLVVDSDGAEGVPAGGAAHA